MSLSLTNENIVSFSELRFENAVKEIKSRVQEKLIYRTVEHSVTSLIKTYKQLKKMLIGKQAGQN